MSPPVSENPPAELVLRPSRSRAVAWFLFTVLVTALYIWLVALYADSVVLWILLVVWVYFTLRALRRACDRTACLRLTARGFAAYDLAGAIIFEWSEVRLFSVGPKGKMVVFDFVSTLTKGSAARKLIHFFAGGDGALPETYGMTASELAALLNEWRERYTPPVESGEKGR